MGRLVDPNSNPVVGTPGKVYGVDVWPGLMEKCEENLKREDGDLLEEGTVTVQLGDGWKGLPDKAPFDAIHVGAAASEFPGGAHDATQGGRSTRDSRRPRRWSPSPLSCGEVGRSSRLFQEGL